MADYYVRYHCADCDLLHGVYDCITCPDSGLSGQLLSAVYSETELQRFQGQTVRCWPRKLIEIDVDRLVLASVIATAGET
jgi:hypothetical protein